MAVQSGSPNLENYRIRLGDIVQGIVAGSIYLAPGLGSGVSPFWVISRPRITTANENWQTKLWTIQLDFFLARQKVGNIQVEELAALIDRDAVAVLNYFLDNQKLIVGALTADQSGFLPGTFTIAANSDAVFNSGNGAWLGSSYTLGFRHRVVYTRDNA